MGFRMKIEYIFFKFFGDFYRNINNRYLIKFSINKILWQVNIYYKIKDFFKNIIVSNYILFFL